ncbi:uncharacterized protein BKA78DRAFT_351592 [Phyllosticta capitalensis]|uniref:uncharacterized protein n=1 Tax=Phyllosticta capitalensis TaxID=121624 RepID=UPI00312E51B3
MTPEDLLHHAIEIAEAARIRHVLRIVCAEAPEARKLVEYHLIAQEKFVPGLASLKSRREDLDKTSEDSDSGSDSDFGTETYGLESSNKLDMLRILATPSGETAAARSVGQTEQISQHQECKSLESEQRVDSKGPRKRSRYAVCERCENSFDVTANSADSCAWHETDDREPNWRSSTWDDWDEKGCGPIYHPDNLEEYPQGWISTNSGESCHYHDGFLGDEDEERNELDGADFQYSCCRKKVGTSGCKTGPHRETKAEQSQPEIKKKMRLESILC